MVRMPAFGLSGPWRDRVGFAPTMEQIAGLAWVTGLPEGPPVAPRGACDPLAGAHAAFALLAALEFADRTGRGQLVEVPMIETVLNVTAVQTMEFEVFGSVMERRGNRGHTAAMQDIYRCAGDDNWIAVTVRSDEERDALAKLMGSPDVRLEDWLAGQDAAVVAGTPCRRRYSGGRGDIAVLGHREPATAAPRLLRAPRASANRAGLYPCPPFARFEGAENWLLRTPPTLGQHTSEVLTALCGLTDADLERLAADEVIGTRPKGV